MKLFIIKVDREIQSQTHLGIKGHHQDSVCHTGSKYLNLIFGMNSALK
jgi:hypothetical protein